MSEQGVYGKTGDTRETFVKTKQEKQTMRKRSWQVHSRESAATLQLTESLLYLQGEKLLTRNKIGSIIKNMKSTTLAD